MIDLQKLIYFKSVVEEQSYTKAADKLYISQPTISKSIALLEKQYKNPLLVRDSKKVYPTKAGKILYNIALKLLENAQNAEIEISEKITDEMVPIDIGLPPVSGAKLIPIIYNDLVKESIIINEVIEDGSYNLINLVEKEQLDIAYVILESVPDIHDLKTVEISKGSIKVLVNSNWNIAKKETVNIKELLNLPYFPYKNSSFIQNKINEILEKNKLKLNKLHTYSQVMSLINAVTNGVGFMFVMENEFYLLKNNSNIKTLDLEPKIEYKTCFIYKDKFYTKKSVRDFIKLVKKNLNIENR